MQEGMGETKHSQSSLMEIEQVHAKDTYGNDITAVCPTYSITNPEKESHITTAIDVVHWQVSTVVSLREWGVGQDVNELWCAGCTL